MQVFYGVEDPAEVDPLEVAGEEAGFAEVVVSVVVVVLTVVQAAVLLGHAAAVAAEMVASVVAVVGEKVAEVVVVVDPVVAVEVAAVVGVEAFFEAVVVVVAAAAPAELHNPQPAAPTSPTYGYRTHPVLHTDSGNLAAGQHIAVVLPVANLRQHSELLVAAEAERHFL